MLIGSPHQLRKAGYLTLNVDGSILDFQEKLNCSAIETVSPLGDSTFSSFAPKLWNSLPSVIRHAESLGVLKSSIKTHFF